jgi:UDP-N-acetylmuramoylalanine--D-glutamate ligase
VIVGLGATGFSCVEYFVGQQKPIIVIDSRLEPPKLAELKRKYPQVPVVTGCLPADILSKAASIVLSPGISRFHPDIVKSVSNDIECIGDIELFARRLEAPVIAITGSNGKSTVTSLVGHMALTAGVQVAVGGNLGTPVLALKPAELYVLELSSFQLETTYGLKPLVATVLNICPDHLDRYPDIETYRAAKHRIFQHCQKIVVNKEDAFANEGIPQHCPTLSFGLQSGADFSLIQDASGDWLAYEHKRLLAVSELNILGSHNIANALAALSIGLQAGFSLESMLSALRTFKGLPHRGEWVKNEQDILWMNDSKGTNVGATIATLIGVSALISGKWVIILGGDGKNADFSPLAPILKKYCKTVVLIGKEQKTLNDLKQLLNDANLSFCYAKNMEEAVNLAEKLVNPGDGVLLSPACASYDMFKNFEERGEAFKHACTA